MEAIDLRNAEQDRHTQKRKFSQMERYFLRHFHPRRIIIDVIAMMWATYFLWQGNWVVAAECVVVSGVLGIYFTRNVDPELMAQTTLGRIGLLHHQPLNLILNLLGSVILVYGLWRHSSESILGGLSVIVFGHFFGWSEVNENLRTGKF